MTDQGLGETLQHLRGRGFTPIAGATPTLRAFEGELSVSAGKVPVSLVIEDWDFLTYPRIELTDRPAFLPQPMPHIDTTGALCYLANGSVVLDRYNPAGAMELCLQTAERLLESIIQDPTKRQIDVRDEFLAYWAGGPLHFSALIGNIGLDTSRAQFAAITLPPDRRNGAKLIVVHNSTKELEGLARSLKATVEKERLAPCWIFRASTAPVAPTGRLPQTVQEALKYLQAWNPEVYRAFHHALETDLEYLKHRDLAVAIHSPAGWLGFFFHLDPTLAKGFAKRPSAYRQHLHGKGATTPITRMELTEFGTDFLHARNLDCVTLAGKRIHLIGCGAIGGFMAQSIARLGAGSLGGVLKVIDPEYLEPGNIGRHWLGMSSLYLPKAQGVVEELSRHFPDSRFEALVADARTVPNLFSADLVIDATGIEPLSEALNAAHCAGDRSKTAHVLYTWVVGNGEAVQTLLVDKQKFGCYGCLRLPKDSRYREERFPVQTKAPKMRITGCGEYRPYSVSAPMAATTLATELIVDWLSGSASPRFRTQRREGSSARQLKNQDLEALQGCPACRR